MAGEEAREGIREGEEGVSRGGASRRPPLLPLLLHDQSQVNVLGTAIEPNAFFSAHGASGALNERGQADDRGCREGRRRDSRLPCDCISSCSHSGQPPTKFQNGERGSLASLAPFAAPLSARLLLPGSASRRRRGVAQVSSSVLSVVALGVHQARVEGRRREGGVGLVLKEHGPEGVGGRKKGVSVIVSKNRGSRRPVVARTSNSSELGPSSRRWGRLGHRRIFI